MFYTGCVENRMDPLEIGRCQVRILGLHSENKIELPTIDLPWAYPVTPITSASISGIGNSPVGPVEGTWVIVFFRDEDQQQPIMLGSIGGIPQSKAADLAAQDSNGTIIATDSGVLVNSVFEEIKTAIGIPINVGTRESFNNASTAPEAKQEPLLTEQKIPNKAIDAVIAKDIPINPPGADSEQQQGILALINACDKLGLSGKYAKCAILGICGIESAWVPAREGHRYKNPDYLYKMFSSSFSGPSDPNIVKYANMSNDIPSKEAFFKFIYRADCHNGKKLGNTSDNDGALYYGKGFTQITGRSNYAKAEKDLRALGIEAPLITQPDLMVTNIEISAYATVMFYKNKVSTSSEDPNYFNVALEKVGGDPAGKPKKRDLYEFFLGEKTSVAPTSKPMVDVNRKYSTSEVAGLPTSKRSALLEDRSENTTVGFSDPSGKYPLRNLLDEADTNRLARGVQKETALEYKDATRVVNIGAANGEGSWEQPLAPFGGRYPYSKVMESESGHLMIFDDTPANENISTYHRTGTFTEVDANGTQVNRIMGDGYEIIDRNGSIYIGGNANITIINSANVYVQGTADVQVDGYATINLKNNADIGVGGDLKVAVGGNIDVKAGGYINMESGQDTNIKSLKNINTHSVSSMNTMVGESYNIKTTKDFNLKAEVNSYFITGTKSNIQATTLDLKTSANLNIDYTVNNMGSGATSISSKNDVTDVANSTLSAPDFTTGNSSRSDYLPTPVRPAPPVITKKEITDENGAITDRYNADPSAYYNPEAAANGVKGNIAPQPKDDGQGQSLISGALPSDIIAFLDKQLDAAASGYWRETGMKGTASNPNILRIWSDLGLNFKSDQVPWCAGFMNWTLQQCGYRFSQNGRAFGIDDNPSAWKATKISDLNSAEPGDIIVWKFSHVSFLYSNDGALVCVGGNQSPKGGTTNNNPSLGDLTKSNGKVGNIKAIYRPSKV